MGCLEWRTISGPWMADNREPWMADNRNYGRGRWIDAWKWNAFGVTFCFQLWIQNAAELTSLLGLIPVTKWPCTVGEMPFHLCVWSDAAGKSESEATVLPSASLEWSVVEKVPWRKCRGESAVEKLPWKNFRGGIVRDDLNAGDPVKGEWSVFPFVPWIGSGRWPVPVWRLQRDYCLMVADSMHKLNEDAGVQLERAFGQQFNYSEWTRRKGLHVLL